MAIETFNVSFSCGPTQRPRDTRVKYIKMVKARIDGIKTPEINEKQKSHKIRKK